jgi:aminoacrylate hydrolase
MPVVVRDGADLYWEKIGAGPALILGAGLNGSGKWWDPNRLALAKRFTVYTFDQRGTGRSSKIPVASIEQMAADLVAVMDNAGLESAVGGPEVQASRLNAILAFDRRTEFHRITVPTLVLGADDDLLAPRYFSDTGSIASWRRS